jgi:hypothetical protein
MKTKVEKKGNLYESWVTGNWILFGNIRLISKVGRVPRVPWRGTLLAICNKL